jgi:hypothetical protein
LIGPLSSRLTGAIIHAEGNEPIRSTKVRI